MVKQICISSYFTNQSLSDTRRSWDIFDCWLQGGWWVNQQAPKVQGLSTVVPLIRPLWSSSFSGSHLTKMFLAHKAPNVYFSTRYISRAIWATSCWFLGAQEIWVSSKAVHLSTYNLWSTAFGGFWKQGQTKALFWKELPPAWCWKTSSQTY